MADIYKAGGILIRDRKILVTRSRGKQSFYAPGGKIEGGETAQQSLVRELKEEVSIEVEESSLTPFGVFESTVVDNSSLTIRMDVFLVTSWKGEITASSEIEELAWVDSSIPEGMTVGSIFAHEVIPRLKEQGLVS